MSGQNLPGRRPQLDLTRTHFQHQRGDILVIGTWWMGDRDEDVEPCIVLMPAHRRIAAPLPPTILMSGAFLWADNPRYAVAKAADFLAILDMTQSLSNVTRICELVTDNIRDLFRMPTHPDRGVIVVADATMRASDGKTLSAEITRLA